MNVVDSSAWLSYFAGDENAEHFAGPIEATDELLVPSVTMTEVFKNVLRQRGEGMALIAVAHMEQGRLSRWMKSSRLMRLTSVLRSSFHWPTALFMPRRTNTLPCCGRKMRTSKASMAFSSMLSQRHAKPKTRKKG